MSAHWTRNPAIYQKCGRCGADIPRGDPMIELILPMLTHKPVRCVACAGPAPPDLPALVESTAPKPERVQRFTKVSSLVPTRTRGALRFVAKADPWTPHRND